MFERMSAADAGFMPKPRYRRGRLRAARPTSTEAYSRASMVYFYKLSKLYGAYLKLFGFEAGINRFLDRLELACPEGCRILDIACGSGIVGLNLLERFPGSTLLATDLERNFLKETQANARERGIDPARITVGLSDLTRPRQVDLLDGGSVTLEDGSFDIVCVGGALGYSKDVEASLEALLGLLKPGGYFINLEMNTKPVGKVIAALYDYRVMPLQEMKALIERAGGEADIVPFGLRDFPANLTRVGLVGRVPA